MKKISFIFAVIAAMIFAADADAQVSVGAGYSHETMTSRIGDDSESDGFDGFYLEATYDWNFLTRGWGMLGLQPGLRFAYVGESETEEEMGYRAKVSWNETYVDVPVYVKYSYPLGRVKLSAFAGPVFSLGLSSVLKTTLTGDGVDYLAKVHMYSGKTVIKGDSSVGNQPEASTDYGRFDLKLGIGVGATLMDKFNVKVGYDFGLLNRYTGEQMENYKSKIHTGMLYVGVGYSF